MKNSKEFVNYLAAITIVAAGGYTIVSNRDMDLNLIPLAIAHGLAIYALLIYGRK